MGADDRDVAAGSLLRPAVDPGIPGSDRDLLTRAGTVLTPAGMSPLSRPRDYLPRHPAKRAAAVREAAMGTSAAAFFAICGAAPWAVGLVIGQAPEGSLAAAGHWALWLALLTGIGTALVLLTRIAWSGEPAGETAAETAARTYHGRYLTEDDFDAPALVLLRRAQNAVDTVAASQVYRAGLLDEPASGAGLAAQEWDIAVSLRDQARLRHDQEQIAGPGNASGPATAAALDHQRQSLRLAEQRTAERVAALERYADDAREADAAYRDWQQSTAIDKLSDRHLDALARTAGDEHGTAEIEAKTQQARAVRLALRELGGRAGRPAD
jgi:hypothetical protein